MTEKINLNIFTRAALEKWLDLWEQAEEIAQIAVQDMHDDNYDDDQDDDELMPSDMFQDDDYEWGPEPNYDSLEPDDEWPISPAFDHATDKCFGCGVNPKVQNKNLCAACLEKADTTPHIDGPDFADGIDDHPFATVTQADLDSYSDDQEAWDDDQDNDDNLCPHCGTAQKPFTDVVDSGEPFYILGTYCWACGRFIELDDQDGES